MLYMDEHKKYNVFEVSPEALRQQGYRSPCLLSGDTSFALSGSNRSLPIIENAQSNEALRGRNLDLDKNITGCSAGLDSYSCLLVKTVTG